ncbi:N-acetylglucosaminyldiphosphoundecaprenol N-acetyl-beta-D-mannosaminyltransferase [Mucilaginibacter sp. UYP25]|uniref:WecB/TagA/CpsF family glycosyltransferase n=1 Tax=unclassified Mucilaginibacter TaxID=2617802 RepID=UPI00339A72A6
MNPTVELLSYSVFAGELNQIKFKGKCVINTINQFSYTIAEKDEEFKQALIHSDILLPDGVGITAAVKFLKREYIKKIAGADLHMHFLNQLNITGGKCFYLGASNVTLGLIKEKLKLEFPNIIVGSYSPPYKAEFSSIDTDLMINAVNAFRPDVLFVGMTAPKQEKWIFKNSAALQAQVICAIGAVFDFYAGTVTRPSKFWQNMGLEWFVRMIKEPRRMYKRYLYYGPYFLGQILRLKFNRSFLGK